MNRKTVLKKLDLLSDQLFKEKDMESIHGFSTGWDGDKVAVYHAAPLSETLISEIKEFAKPVEVEFWQMPRMTFEKNINMSKEKS